MVVPLRAGMMAACKHRRVGRRSRKRGRLAIQPCKSRRSLWSRWNRLHTRRPTTDRLARCFGQPFIVENKDGVGSIGIEFAVRSPMVATRSTSRSRPQSRNNSAFVSGMSRVVALRVSSDKSSRGSAQWSYENGERELARRILSLLTKQLETKRAADHLYRSFRRNLSPRAATEKASTLTALLEPHKFSNQESFVKRSSIGCFRHDLD
jgi:hypothetical protein